MKRALKTTGPGEVGCVVPEKNILWGQWKSLGKEEPEKEQLVILEETGRIL